MDIKQVELIEQPHANAEKVKEKANSWCQVAARKREHTLHLYFLGIKIIIHRVKIWKHNNEEGHPGANIRITAISAHQTFVVWVEV